jgi:ubiquitin C-terminal hydrolase
VAESRRREQYTDWQIPIPQSVEAVKLEDLMKGWGNREKVDWNCGITGDPNNESATQETYLASAPDMLVVMLKRFSMVESKSQSRKHTTPVTFSTEIDLGMIFAGRLVPALVSGGPASLKYNLVGVVNHHGSAPNSGHYNADYYNTHYKQWFHANDASCSKIDVPGTRPSSLPYMFIYTKAQ